MQDLKSFFLLDDICILRDGKQTTMGNLKKKKGNFVRLIDKEIRNF